MSGKRLGQRYNYLTQLGYDKFENRVYLSYGNGTETTYAYENDRRRLQHITAATSNGRKMMDNTYTYDKVNNIMSLTNEAPKTTPNKKGGPFEYNYQYDDLYRLAHAEGNWKGATHEHRYELDMQYSPTGRILQKTQTHDRSSYDEPENWVKQHKTTYDWEYKYESAQPHAATHIGENTYTYDANGNQTGWTNDRNGQRRQILWDEENRMRAIADNGKTHHYIYDASGERVIKSHGDGQAIYINGFPMGGSGTVGNYTVYVNPFMVFQNAKYTKHFYIEGQRIVSKLGAMDTEQALLNPKAHAGDSLKNPVKWDDKKEFSKDIIIVNFEALGLGGAVFTAGKSGKIPYGQLKKYYRNTDIVINPGTTTNTGKKTEDLQFYYHPDHLGSSSYITDVSGEVYQHMEYFPFGETFIEERNDAEYTHYLYNGKELDEETGLYYYGARYYDARTSLWQTVDPLAEKYPEWDSYNYCMSNPIKNTDPTGMSTHTDADGNVMQVNDDKDLGIYKHSDLSGWNKKDVLGKTGKGIDKMGTTKIWNSFTTRGKENKEAGKIDFGSNEAGNWIDNFEKEIGNLIGNDWDKRMQYAMNAGNGDIYDYKTKGLKENASPEEIKSQMYRGSQISPGIYVSARDVGNYAAGAAARITHQDKMDFMLTAGGFQLSGNSKTGILFRTGHWKKEALKAGYPAYGEARESNFFQRLGFDNVRR